jgi:YVTN family beta-propeller protein
MLIRNWPQRPQPIADSSQRMEFKGFSVLPPQGPGWEVLPPLPAVPGAATRLANIGKRPTNPPPGPLRHTAVVTIATLQVPESSAADPKAFEDFVRNKFGTQPPLQLSAKHKVLSVHTGEGSLPGRRCVRFAAQLEDSEVPAAPGRRFLFDLGGYVCLHPKWPHQAVETLFSERYPDDEKPLDLEAEVSPFLTSIAFTDERPIVVTAIPVGPGPQQLVAAEGSIWVAYGDHGVARIDPKTNQMIAQVAVGRDPIGIGFAGGSIWSANRADGTLSRIDPSTSRVTDTVRVGGKPYVLATAAGSLWVTDEEGGVLDRIDPASGRTTARIPVGDSPANMVADDRTIWVTLYTQNRIVRVDPATNAVSANVDVPAAPGVIGEGAGSIWVAGQQEGVIGRVDPATGKLVATIPVFARPSAIASDGESVWVSGYNESTVFRIDPRTNRQTGTRISVGKGPVLMIVVDGALWVSGGLDRFVARVDY